MCCLKIEKGVHVWFLKRNPVHTLVPILNFSFLIRLKRYVQSPLYSEHQIAVARVRPVIGRDQRFHLVHNGSQLGHGGDDRILIIGRNLNRIFADFLHADDGVIERSELLICAVLQAGKTLDDIKLRFARNVIADGLLRGNAACKLRNVRGNSGEKSLRQRHVRELPNIRSLREGCLFLPYRAW